MLIKFINKANLGWVLFLGLNIFGNVANAAICDTDDLDASFTVNNTEPCLGEEIVFINTSTGDKAGSSNTDYEWYYDNSLIETTSGLDNPNNHTPTAGAHVYKLVGKRNSCNTDTFYVNVFVHEVPNTDFSFNPDNVCPGEQIDFTNTSTGESSNGNTTYSWDFDDSQTSSAENPSHTYENGGTYSVTLTVQNGNSSACSSSASHDVTINPAPNALVQADIGDGNGFQFDEVKDCLSAGDTHTSLDVDFTNQYSSSDATFSWDLDDGSPTRTGGIETFTHTYTEYGTYQVIMKATSPDGCESADTILVIFEKNPNFDLDVPTEDLSGCQPHTVHPDISNIIGAINYEWDFGDGYTESRTDSDDVVHTYVDFNEDPGYTIKVTLSNHCNSIYKTVGPIKVAPQPVAAFTSDYGADPVICTSTDITFSTQSLYVDPDFNYYWDMGNGNTYDNYIDNSTDPKHTPPAQNYSYGIYQVMLIARNNCGSDTAYHTVIVDTVPELDVMADPYESCSPLITDLTNNSIVNTHGASASYQWWINRGVWHGWPYYAYWPNYTSRDIPDQTFTQTTGNIIREDSIHYVMWNHCGTVDTMLYFFTHPEVHSKYNASAYTVCEGDSITFTQVSDGDSLDFVWDFGRSANDTTTLVGPHTICYPDSGDYYVQLVTNGYCGTDTITKLIRVNHYPIADIGVTIDSVCSEHTFSFTNNSTTGASNYWNFGSTASPSSSNAYDPGNITYTLSAPANTTVTEMVTYRINLNGCWAYDTAYIDVNPLPVVDFNRVPTDGCEPLLVEFRNTSTNTVGDSYLWNFDDGNTSTDEALTDSITNTFYANAGATTVYDVMLTATTLKGCIDSMSRTVTVYPLPQAGFVVAEDTLCSNINMLFNDTSIGASTYDWFFGDGDTLWNTSNATPTHDYPDSTMLMNYTATQIARSNYGCVDTATMDLVIYPIPQVDFINDTVCYGDETTLTSLSTGGDTYKWTDASNTVLSTADQFSYLFSSSGTHNITLEVSNDNACVNSITKPVLVNDMPVADFMLSDSCYSQTIHFTDQTTGMPIGWEWHFSDGTVLTDQNVDYTYTTTGLDSVMLVVSGGSCTDTITKTFTIHPIPNFDFSTVESCMNEGTAFDTTNTVGTGADQFDWSFGDGATGNTATISHTYNSSGYFDVQLVGRYTNSGCTDTVRHQIHSYPRSVPTFTTNTPCLNYPTGFSADTANGTNSWYYDFGDSNDSLAVQDTIQYIYNTEGTYSVNLITTNIYGCIDSLRKDITVNPLPNTQFVFDTVCQGFNTVFSADLSDSNTDTWNWKFGDGNTATGSNTQNIYAVADTFTVTLITENTFNCIDSLQQDVIVRPNPISGFIDQSNCNTYDAEFIDTSLAVSEGTVTREWHFGYGTTIGTDSIQTFMYPDSSETSVVSYDVMLISTNMFACQDTSYYTHQVLPMPKAGFINDVVCAREEVTFIDTSIGARDTWYWSYTLEGGPSNDIGTSNDTITHVFDLGNTYDVQLIVTNGSSGCSDTVIKPIVVHTVPVVEFSFDTVCRGIKTSFVNLSTDEVPMTYFWDFDDGNDSRDQHPTYIFQDPGVFNVMLTTTNTWGCRDSVEHSVLVSTIPTPVFTFDTVCLNQPTHFYDLSTDAPETWFWNFNDGTTSNEQNPTHTYQRAGKHFLQLTVTALGGCIAPTISDSVLVYDLPIVDAGKDTTTCPESAVELTASGNFEYYDWGAEGNTQTITVYPTESTKYTVTVTDINTCQSSDSVWVLMYTGGAIANDDFLELETEETKTIDVFTNDTGLVSSIQIIEHALNGSSSNLGNGMFEYTSYIDYVGQDSILYQICDEYCPTICDQATVRINIVPKSDIFIPEGVSANGDGKNDFFEITGLEYHPKNELVIFNRWGVEVYRASPYQNEWEGQSLNETLKLTGDKVVNGTYYYVLKLNDEEGRVFSGYIEFKGNK